MADENELRIVVEDDGSPGRGSAAPGADPLLPPGGGKESDLIKEIRDLVKAQQEAIRVTQESSKDARRQLALLADAIAATQAAQRPRDAQGRFLPWTAGETAPGSRSGTASDDPGNVAAVGVTRNRNFGAGLGRSAGNIFGAQAARVGARAGAGLGTAIAGAAGLGAMAGPIGVAVGTAAGVVIGQGVSQSLEKLVGVMGYMSNGIIEELKEINGTLSIANAMASVERLQGQLAQADQLAPSLSLQVAANTRVESAIRSLITAVGGQVLPSITKITDLIADYIEAVTPVATFFASIVGDVSGFFLGIAKDIGYLIASTDAYKLMMEWLRWITGQQKKQEAEPLITTQLREMRDSLPQGNRRRRP